MRRTASNRYISEQASVIKASTLLTQGKQLFQSEDWLGAAQMFREALALIPDHGETKTLLANAEAKISQEKVSLAEPAKRSERPEVKSPEKKTVQEKSVSAGKVQPKFSPKVIGFVALAVVGLIGITGAALWLFGNKQSSVSSVGMVQVPSGSYTVGADTAADLGEFWIDRYEVTNGDYAKFVSGTRNKSPEYWSGDEPPTGLTRHPVSHISWDQAKAYCSWVGKRLPTEF